LLQVPGISQILSKISPDLLTEQIRYLQSEVVELIEAAIKTDPAITLTEGDIIKEGFNLKLDQLRKEASGGKDFLQSLEEQEIKRTGISSLKVRYNKVFGYYIEISKSNLSKVPTNYIRKQTLTNAERYITEELKIWEEKILNSSELLSQMEYQLFEEIRSRVSLCFDDIVELAKIIAEIDIYLNFAELAIHRNYTKPQLHDNHEETLISESRHPVVESFLQEQFIPNDITFKTNEQELIVLTGPNMSGKSTYIRQIALIFLMAQIGSFVPAAKADITIVDRIFTRVGASDNLTGGESTFMVEMLETANILNNATKNSLLILDEVGRGTSTYDGMALAWAIIEYIVKELHSKTLFATHYHDLMLLEDLFPMIKNYNIKVLESEGEVAFMHKIEKGGIDKSFGIHVAKLAGLPVKTIKRAIQIQEELQKKSIKSFIEKHNLIKDAQLNILTTNKAPLEKPKHTEIIEEIKTKDTDNMTPIAALSLLKAIQEKIRNEN
jgi:DNA mismatch repair protein MutS